MTDKKFLFLTRGDWLALIVCLAAGGALSAFLLYDVLCDLANYHYYNGFAFVHNRYDIDVAPAGYHSFFNPLLDAVNWFLIKHLDTKLRLYFALTGLPFGLLLFVCLKINRLFFTDKIAIAASMVLGATGFATWFQIGSTSNEIPVAVLVLTALYWMLKGEKELFAAFLLGAAAGLKPTAATYCLSSGIVFIAFNRRDFKRIGLFALCGLLGFLATNGFWMCKLYAMYQNPFFPFFNGVFRSPWFAAANFTPMQLESPDLNTSLPKLLLLPLLLISVTEGSEPTLDHMTFSDFRWLFAAVLLVVWAVRARRIEMTRPEKFLAFWLIVSYVVWIKAFLVVRYLIPVEMMLPVFFVKAAASWRPLTGSTLKQAVKISACVVLFAMCVGTVWNSGVWGKLSAGENARLRPDFPDKLIVPEDTVFLTSGNRNSMFLAQVAEKAKIRIVNRDENLWPFIAKTKWGEKIKNTANEPAIKALWMTSGTSAIAVDGMTCRPFRADMVHTVCFPDKIAGVAFLMFQP